MIHLPKITKKPAYRYPTRSKASKLASDKTRRAFLAKAKADAEREANAEAAARGFRETIAAQEQEARDRTAEHREEERDYMSRQGDAGTDSMLNAIDANGGRFTI